MKKREWVRKKYIAVLTILLSVCMCNGCGAGVQEAKEVLSDLEATHEEATIENAGEKQEQEEIPEKELTLENLQEEIRTILEERSETATWKFRVGDMTGEEINGVLQCLSEWDDLLYRYYIARIEFEKADRIGGKEPYAIFDVKIEYYDDCVNPEDIYHVHNIEDVYNAFSDSLQTGFEETVLYVHSDLNTDNVKIEEVWELAYYADQVSWDCAENMPYLFRQIMHSLYEVESGDALLVVNQEYDVYQLTKEQQQEAQKLVEAEVDALAEQVRAYSESKDEQSKYLYQLITERVDFDYELSDMLLDVYNETNPEVAIGRGIYGALLEGESVCSGYAAAYKAVCDRLDIPCKVLIGYTENGDHAWNMIIKEDGTIAYVDPSWGDSERWFSTYYDISDEVIAAENRRIYDYEYIPQEFIDAGFSLERAPQFLYDDVETK